MSSRHPAIRAAAAAMAVALTLAACAQPASIPASTAMAAASQRGAGSDLKILYWQAPIILNTHLAQGTKDFDAARLVLEPLAHMGPEGRPLAALAAEVPTIANNGVSKDFTTVTWKLRSNVKWSDGSAFTSADVVFTYDFVSNKATAASTAGVTAGVKSVEALDALTVKVTYAAPNPNVYQMFVGDRGTILQEKQFREFMGAKAKDAPANQRPIGTGPYKLKEFKPGDVVLYEINENYRDPNKPFFKTVTFKGGGDATSAARAVFQTGEADYSWNLQVEAALLRPMIEAASSQGRLVTAISSNAEKLVLNRANPDVALGDRRAEPDQPHPFLSDLKVRKALAMAIDRRPMAELYGGGLAGGATCNIVVGVPALTSKNTASMDVCRFDLAAANALLDEAGATRGSDGVRVYKGKPMQVIFQTTVNPLRQKQQAVVKEGWEKLGLKVELKAVQPAVFFGRDGTDAASKFFADVQMFTNLMDSPDPTSTLARWTCAEIKTKAANWSGANYERWCNRDYDALYGQLGQETDPAKRNEIVIKMNDLLISDVAVIALVARNQPVTGISKRLQGVLPNPWDSEMWNIADWTK